MRSVVVLGGVLLLFGCGGKAPGTGGGTDSDSVGSSTSASSTSSTSTSTSTGTDSGTTTGASGSSTGELFLMEPDGSSCFAAGTRVATPDGERAIEELRVGDPVYAYDHERGARVVSHVDARFVHPPAPVLNMGVGERTLRVTGNHPIYRADLRRYVPAGQMDAGDPLLAWKGSAARIRGLVHTAAARDEPVPVFNISVAGPHNYFAEGVLVHNKSPECDLWSQDCSDGEKCMPWANDGGGSWNATKCTPVDPNPKQPGDPCTVEGNGVSGVDDCDKTAMCWDVDPETNEGTCVAFCTGSEADASCADPTTSCVIANDGVLILCLLSCDPLVQGCPNMDLCIPQPVGDGFVCVLDASGDMGVAGDPCEYVNVCDPGLFCANAASVPNCQGSAGCCAPFCDLTNPMCPAEFESGGAECVPWYEMGMEPPAYKDVGACVIPQ